MGSTRPLASLGVLLASSAWLLACSTEPSGNDEGACAGGAACAAPAAGTAGSAAGASGMLTAAGSSGLGGATAAGGTGGVSSGTAGAPGSAGAAGVAGAAGASGAGGTGGSAGAAGAAGSAGAFAGAGAGGMAGTLAGAGAGAGNGGMDAGADAPPPLPYEPLYRIPVRIHAADSALTDMQFTDVTAEVNLIWRSQAGVCFEFELVDHDQLGPGLDIWYSPGSSGDPNGYYGGDDDIFSRDEPSLGAAPNPVQIATARTTAHEFGHALGLAHQDFGDACPDGDGTLDCDDLLMRSGRRGFFLSEPEIETARGRAEDKALDDTSPLDCGPLVIMR